MTLKDIAQSGTVTFDDEISCSCLFACHYLTNCLNRVLSYIY